MTEDTQNEVSARSIYIARHQARIRQAVESITAPNGVSSPEMKDIAWDFLFHEIRYGKYPIICTTAISAVRNIFDGLS